MTLPDKTPYETWFGIKTSVVCIRIFGCVAFAHISKDLHHKFSTEKKMCVTMIIARPIVYGILKLIKLLRVKGLFFTKILLEILIMWIVTIVIFIKKLFLDFLMATLPKVVGKQPMVTQVVKNQDTTWTKHQKQVASSGVVNEHNMIPYNIQPWVPEQDIIVEIMI